MPNSTRHFLLENNPNKFTELLSQLAQRGITQEFIHVNDDNLVCISLEKTVLTVSVEALASDRIIYFLYYQDSLLCTTQIKQKPSLSAQFFDELSTQIQACSLLYTLYGLPDWLLHDQPLEKSVHLAQDFLFKLGKKKPEELNMRQLSYVGIQESHLIKQKDTYYFKLSPQAGFTKLDDRTLQYKGVTIICMTKFDDIGIQSDEIVESTGSMAVVLNNPIWVTKNFPFEKCAYGTIEGCAEGLQKNQYDAFHVATFPPSWFISEHFNYKPFNESNKQQLFHALQKNTSLKMLKLAYVGLTDADVKKLVAALKNHPSLTALELQGNHISNQGAIAIAQFITNSYLTHLNLEHNRIGNAGINALVRALKNNDTVTTLDLKENAYTEASIDSIMDLVQTNSTLTELSINYFFLEPTYSVLFKKALKDNIKLQGINQRTKISCQTFFYRNVQLADKLESIQDAYNDLDLLELDRLLDKLRQEFPGINDGSLRHPKQLVTFYANMLMALGAIEIDSSIQLAFSRLFLWLLRDDLNHPFFQPFVRTCVKKLQGETDAPTLYQENRFVSLLAHVKNIHSNHSFLFEPVANLLQQPTWQPSIIKAQQNGTLIIETLFDTPEKLSLFEQLHAAQMLLTNSVLIKQKLQQEEPALNLA